MQPNKVSLAWSILIGQGGRSLATESTSRSSEYCLAFGHVSCRKMVSVIDMYQTRPTFCSSTTPAQSYAPTYTTAQYHGSDYYPAETQWPPQTPETISPDWNAPYLPYSQYRQDCHLQTPLPVDVPQQNFMPPDDVRIKQETPGQNQQAYQWIKKQTYPQAPQQGQL